MKTNTNNRIAPVIDIVTGRPVETKRSVRNVAASVVAAATLGAGAFIMGANTAPEPPRGETVICVDETTQKAKPGDNLGAMTADKLDILSEEAKKNGRECRGKPREYQRSDRRERTAQRFTGNWRDYC